MTVDQLLADQAAGTSPSPIERVVTYNLHVPLRRQIADALYVRTHWNIPVVEVSTSDGLTGTGYSGIWEGQDLVLSSIDKYMGPLITGRDARAIGELWDAMYWSPLHWVGRAGVTHIGLGMVDMALWDLAAQRAGIPLWQLLGGRHRQVETYNTDGGWLNFTVDELVEDTLAMVEAGWNSVKMKVGGPDPRVDVERVRRVREALPKDVSLMVDVNQKWDLMTARRCASEFARLDVGWMEEPLHPDDVVGHAALCAKSPVPIALGENVYSAEAFANFLALSAVDIVQVDVTRVAGISEWLRVASAAQSAARAVIPHAGDMMQVHQHLVAATSPARVPMIEYLPWGLEVFEHPVQLAKGTITLPSKPGASSTIAKDARRRYKD
ncbi:MAG TPA: mandelate racemase/muconate lactonizing enzyme family protein [Acidimicrobiales bacterium]|nr:mandelate racemase/muconate lactonizing enzyme family protein [Acidimicrobiales bacterium]